MAASLPQRSGMCIPSRRTGALVGDHMYGVQPSSQVGIAENYLTPTIKSVRTRPGS